MRQRDTYMVIKIKTDSCKTEHILLFLVDRMTR